MRLSSGRSQPAADLTAANVCNVYHSWLHRILPKLMLIAAAVVQKGGGSCNTATSDESMSDQQRLHSSAVARADWLAACMPSGAWLHTVPYADPPSSWCQARQPAALSAHAPRSSPACPVLIASRPAQQTSSTLCQAQQQSSQRTKHRKGSAQKV